MDDDQSVLDAANIVAVQTIQRELYLSAAADHGREVLGKNQPGDLDRRSRGRDLTICDGLFLRP